LPDNRLERRTFMPESANGDGHIACDLITWQQQAQCEPVERLAVRVGDELDHLAVTLDELTELLREPPCPCGCTKEAIIDATKDILQLGTAAAICILGLVRRNPGGVGFTTASSVN
jgi:hypothetical protein